MFEAVTNAFTIPVEAVEQFTNAIKSIGNGIVILAGAYATHIIGKGIAWAKDKFKF